MKYLIVILSACALSACSFMPKPLNNPSVSTFGKKCHGDAWSYVWIHDRDTPLSASSDQCKE